MHEFTKRNPKKSIDEPIVQKNVYEWDREWDWARTKWKKMEWNQKKATTNIYYDTLAAARDSNIFYRAKAR